MVKKRSSKIWLASTEEVREAVDRSQSMAAVLRTLGVFCSGASMPTLRKRCEEDNIDLSKFPRGQAANKGRKFGPHKNRIPDNQLFVENSHTSRSVVRKRLLVEKQIPYTCAECGIRPKWKGKSLSLVLDHINGVNNDHRLENLRFLCPNCNSQTPTFAGRNLAWAGTQYTKCTQCTKKIGKSRNVSGLCKTCYHTKRSADVEHSSRIAIRKVKERPSKDELQKLLIDNNWREIGRMYGITDNSVRKWAKGYGLPAKRTKTKRTCSKCVTEIDKRNKSGMCIECYKINVWGK